MATHTAIAEVEDRPGQRAEYRDPPSLADAQEQRHKVLDEIANITTQLRDPLRTDDEGWRRKALVALRARESVLRRINAWIGTRRRETTPIKIIRDAHTLFVRIIEEEDLVLEADEQSVVDALKAYLDEHE